MPIVVGILEVEYLFLNKFYSAIFEYSCREIRFSNLNSGPYNYLQDWLSDCLTPACTLIYGYLNSNSAFEAFNFACCSNSCNKRRVVLFLLS